MTVKFFWKLREVASDVGIETQKLIYLNLFYNTDKLNLSRCFVPQDINISNIGS